MDIANHVRSFADVNVHAQFGKISRKYMTYVSVEIPFIDNRVMGHERI